MRLTAKYEGRCPGCGEPIEPGQMIAWDPGNPAHHLGCDAEPPEPARRPVCIRCFQEKAVNGACGCVD